MKNQPDAATRAVRASIESDVQHGAVVPPLHLSSNFSFKGFGEKRQYDYTRSGNPTRDALADALTELEGGAGCVVTSSGMAALTLVTQLLSPGDTIIAPHDCYGGTYRLLQQQSSKGLYHVLFVDQTDIAALETAALCKPKIILTETPSNPLLRIVDIQGVASIARRVDAVFVVDNTFLSPALQNPIELGADLVVHSTTKYLNGHSDVVGGCVVAADDALAEELAFWANCIGITGAPFDSFLTLRGLRTLHPRIGVHEANATAIADYLQSEDLVTRVFYPGLESHTGHQLASQQQKGFGGMLSFEIDGGEDTLRTFLAQLQYFSLAESLGGVESLVCHPASMTHAAVSESALAEAGIGQNLVRLSVGIESETDLIADLSSAFQSATNIRKSPRRIAASA